MSNNINGLLEHSKKRNEETITKVNKAILSLKRSKKKITITAVAKKAGIATATIYNNPSLKERITQLKDLEGDNIPDSDKTATGRLKSPYIIKIDKLKSKVDSLQTEIEQLKLEKGLLLGKLKDSESNNLELKAALTEYRKIKK